MKLVVILSLLIATSAMATETATQRAKRFEDWRSNMHHRLIDCGMFYAYFGERMKEKNPEAAQRLLALGETAFEMAATFEFDERVNQARMRMWAQDIKKNFNYEGSYSVLIERDLQKCTDLVNGGFIREANANIPK